jgi:hypothetical protein
VVSAAHVILPRVKVGDSVRHALDNWDDNEVEGAMLHACNAVDGTGKKRYDKFGVGARFKKTIRDSLDLFAAFGGIAQIDPARTRFPIPVKSDLPDRRPDVADILYGIHRCTHGHGDELPAGFELTPYNSEYTTILIEEGKINLPTRIIVGLLAVAVFAPENKGQPIPDGYHLKWHTHTFMINQWWGRHDLVRDIIATVEIPVVTMNFGDWWDDWTPL